MNNSFPISSKYDVSVPDKEITLLQIKPSSTMLISATLMCAVVLVFSKTESTLLLKVIADGAWLADVAGAYTHNCG